MNKYKVILEFDPHDHNGNDVEIYDEVIIYANNIDEAELKVSKMDYGDRILNYVNEPMLYNEVPKIVWTKLN